MDYANGILLNVPDVSIKLYLCLQNMSAKITLNRRKHSSTTKTLKILHWLPVRARINFKILSLTHQCIHGTAPDYLKSLINLRKPRRSLQSNLNSEYNLETPFNKHKTFGTDHSVGGTPLWNELPHHIKAISNHSDFKQQCKTFLFNKFLM